MSDTSQSMLIPVSDIDSILTAQLIVAWAGETGEERRLGWWRSDLVSEFGGEDLFQKLLPHTWAWATLQGAREAARRADAEGRKQDHNPDRILSLYALGFALDEKIEERFMDLKRGKQKPIKALPGLQLLEAPWSPSAFADWVGGHGQIDAVGALVGRRIKGHPPTDLSVLARRLVAGLAPLGESYPLPHFRRDA